MREGIGPYFTVRYNTRWCSAAKPTQTKAPDLCSSQPPSSRRSYPLLEGGGSQKQGRTRRWPPKTRLQYPRRASSMSPFCSSSLGNLRCKAPHPASHFVARRHSRQGYLCANRQQKMRPQPRTKTVAPRRVRPQLRWASQQQREGSSRFILLLEETSFPF